jgi:hypothetical protein
MVLAKYFTTESTGGNAWSSEVKELEKTPQLAHLMIHFGGFDTVGDGVVMCKFTG